MIFFSDQSDPDLMKSLALDVVYENESLLNKFKKDIVIPNYFEPFKRENIKLRYAIWPGKKILPIFKGDCDQDRPNVI